MRTLYLSAFAILAVFGIPRFANEYRASQLEAKTPAPVALSPSAASRRIESLPAINAGPLPQMMGRLAEEKPAGVRLVPVSLQPSGVPAVEASRVPEPPPGGQELIAAIQKELSRLGYYDGPSNGRWNRAGRRAARVFIRRSGGYVRNPAPSVELLTSLMAANLVKPEAKPDRAPALELKPIRQAELRVKETAVNVKETAAKESLAAPEAAPSDDYLPPWMTRNANAGKPDASAAANGPTPPAVSDATRKARHKRQRREWDAYAYSSRRWRGESFWGF